MENKENIVGRQKILRRLLLCIGVFFVLIIMCILALRFLGYIDNCGRNVEEQRRKELLVLLPQIIDSIRSNTDFYKKYADESALTDLAELGDTESKMAGSYDIVIIDYDIEMFECRVKFGDKTTFRVDMAFHGGLPILYRFEQEHPKQMMPFQ